MSFVTSDVTSEELLNLVATEYDLGTPDRCILMHSGLNDSYRIEIEDQRYALRLHGDEKWWIGGRADLLFELDLVTFLHGEGLPIAFPLPKREGDLLGKFKDREYSLFSWAPGVPGCRTATHARMLGETLARIHLTADRFHSDHRRYALDERALLDRFVDLMEPSLANDDPADAAFIRSGVAEIRQRLRDFDPGPSGWGLIHGDVQELNFHFTPENRISFFDFDLCGYGWRAYEISYYYTRIREEFRAPVIAGYESVRPLGASEHEMLPIFGKLAWIREGLVSKDLVTKLIDPYMTAADFARL
jgi:Ser/Thr protein kinase RdoA (MazF antagonist)